MIIISFLYAVCGVTWVAMLVTPGDIFEMVPIWFSRAPEWFRHVFFGCERCFTGQLALWSYFPLTWYLDLQYDIIEHILVILLSIFFAGFMGKLYNRI